MDTVNNVKSPRRRISTTLAGVAGLLFLAGCATNAPQDTWQAKGPNAQKISDLQWIVFPIAGVVGVLVLALAGYIMFKYRDKGQPIPTQGHGKPTAEIILTIVETSRDVIHSYWIPALNGKKDAVPGRIHLLRLEADKPGIFAGQCTEFCGLSHANMRMEAVALSKEDFAKWVASQQKAYTSPADGTLAKEGETVFLNQCVRCHQVNGLKKADGTPALAAPDENVYSGAAPNLSHLMSRNTFAGAMFDLLRKSCRADVWDATSEEFGAKYLAGVSESCLNQTDLRAWLRNAPAMKPMYADPTKLTKTGGKYRGMPNLGLTEDDIDKLVAYLLTLK